MSHSMVPFTGRTTECDAIRAALREGAGVLVVGEGGSGRTRLLAEAVAALELSGTPVLRVTGAGADVPFGALAHLLPGSPDAVNPIRWAAEAIWPPAPVPSPTPFPSPVPAPIPVPGPVPIHGPGRAAGGRMVLVVDDGHLLDAHSAATVRHLVVHRGARLAVSALAGAALPPAILSLWKDGRLSRLDLAPLSAQDTARLLAAALSGDVEPATARSLRHAAGGNVRLLVELVASQSFTRVDGRWRWRGELVLTGRLRQLVLADIGALDDAEREVLEYVATGEPLALDTLIRLTSPGAVERVERRVLIAVEVRRSGLLVRLAHPLLGRLIRAGSAPVATRNRLGRVREVRGPGEEEATVLSAREFEVARLASWNLTNREIADWLALSPRTVGNHLCSVYTKLGVNRRLDLPPLLV
ncbi:helix-turn-helix transcriptional regulator [Sphaerisporangium corydalis]|uniref:LuxR C-terminal-related transcriptional regulator n=1 Tax=Sphaerisporangium corydalis TaxID=1441875 RepID=A0ABV9ELB1_9ACTN|nr:LuxR C-terminal-related transcriptional regulator [Sphaerisporangium corydalis]